MMSRCVGYVRTASDPDALTAQRQIIAAYCVARGLELIEVFSDHCSGMTPLASRPGGASLLEYVQHQVVDHVVVPDMSRISRCWSDLNTVVDLLASADVQLHLVHSGPQAAVSLQAVWQDERL